MKGWRDLIEGRDFDITIEKIKELRDLTGSNMLTCKRALKYGSGDIELATAYIKAVGLAVSTPYLSFDERIKNFLGKNI